MKTILLATDFSENANHAAFFGYDLAKHLHAKVAIATAIAVPIVVPESRMELRPIGQQITVIEHYELDLKRLKNDLKNGSYEHSYKPKVESLCKVGPLNDVISDINDQQKIDLVVMGTDKGGAFTRLLSGHHSREFINNWGIPMLLVPKSNSLKSIKKIAFATELKHLENDLESIYQIIDTARPLHAEILMVHTQKCDEEVPENEKAFKEFTAELSNKSIYPLIYYKILETNL
jgi:nucleotide-binding universal stress UspA family protein